jgi:hypothetical protein
MQPDEIENVQKQLKTIHCVLKANYSPYKHI